MTVVPGAAAAYVWGEPATGETVHRPILFELHVDDPDEATGEGDGIDGAVGPAQEHRQSVVLTMEAEDVDAARLRAIDAQRMTVPGIGWIIMAVDPNGVRFGMLQADESASV